MTDFNKMLLKSKMWKASECAKVFCMPFKPEDSIRQARITECANELGCSARFVKISRFYSAMIIELDTAPKLL